MSTPNDKSKFEFNNSPLGWAAFLLAIDALWRAIKLAAEWQIYNGQNRWDAWQTSIAFVVFTVMILEVGVGFFTRAARNQSATNTMNVWQVPRKKWLWFKGDDPTDPRFRKVIGMVDPKFQKEAQRIVNARRFYGLLCVLLFLLMESYNVVAMIGAQYNTLVTTKTTVEAPQVQDTGTVQEKTKTWKAKLDKATMDLADLKTAFSKKTAEYTKALRSDEYKTLSPSEISALPLTLVYKNVETQYNQDKQKLDKAFDDAQDALLALQDANFLASNVKKSVGSLDHGTAYAYFNSVTGISELTLQFWLTAFPSLFLGLVAGLSLAFFLFGGKR